jgi:hypothetical protein
MSEWGPSTQLYDHQFKHTLLKNTLHVNERSKIPGVEERHALFFGEIFPTHIFAIIPQQAG